MATTTNYGWTTPDDTALVKDGAAAIRTLGSSVDTTTKNLNPETTLGDLAFRSSTSNVNTRIPIGSSGQHLTVVGGVPAWATPSDQTPLTTKGDLFTFSTLDARLGVGANNTVLTADSSEATGLKWAAASSGAMTLIGTTSFTSSSALNINDVFSATYANYIVRTDFVGSGSVNMSMRLRVSGSDNTTSDYNAEILTAYGVTLEGARKANQSNFEIPGATTAGSYIQFSFFNPFATAKTGIIMDTVSIAGSGIEATRSSFAFAAATSFTGFSLIPASGNITGTLRVYGLANS